MINYAILDLETTSKKVFNKVANHAFNDIVAYSIKTKDKHITEYVYKKESYLEDMMITLIKCDVIVAHNAGFELSYLLEYDKMYKWIEDGGKIWCTQKAEYYLSNFKHEWPALRDIAVNKYGCKNRSKHIDDLLFKNKNSIYTCVSELPEDKVLYDVSNDVLDTEIIYIQQQKLVNQRGKIFRNLIENQMDMILATQEMEENGMFVDKAQLLLDQKQLEIDLQAVEFECSELISKYWKIKSV